ncbi:hypothetical protein [Fictibacillus fluitans]|uniref:Uncharacterized protein n=1 Tax=Fictibacillus fluitans TaxID=3058422 RepID=A0ABT8I2W8_9BACL|nr:hypothetical protein [Fictibacillus sp. NE201]MDN4527371.1 hypothetical protein [Fictibacillus sp. NE201]
MSKTESYSLTKQQKWKFYLLHPLLMSIMAFAMLFLLERGWPDWGRWIGLTFGFFLVSFLFGRKTAEREATRGTPSSKQKVASVVLYILLIAVLVFFVLRFFKPI